MRSREGEQSVVTRGGIARAEPMQMSPHEPSTGERQGVLAFDVPKQPPQWLGLAERGLMPG